MRTKKAMLLGVIFLLMVLLSACAAPAPTPTPAPTPSPSPVPAPAPTDVPSTPRIPEVSSEVLYTHDFSSETGSGWDTYTDTEGSVFYEGGTLHVKANVYTDFDTGSLYNVQEFADFALEVETALVDGTDDNSHEILCRVQSTYENNYYCFVISADGFYGLGKYVNDEAIDINPATRSIHINKGRDAINLVRVECVEDNLRLLVNGHLLIDVVDSSFSSGYIGLGACAFTEQDGKDYSEIIFDNVIVTRL
ncbi:hypothetical protein ES703_95814 [subsurface metagenome]